MSSLTLARLAEIFGLDIQAEIETIKQEGPEGPRGIELTQLVLMHPPPNGGVEATLQAIKLVFALLNGEGEDLYILPDEEIRENLRGMQEEAQAAFERDLIDRTWVLEAAGRGASDELGESFHYRLYDSMVEGEASSETPTPCEGGFLTADGSGWEAGETSPDTDPEALSDWERAMENWKETAPDPTDISASDRPTRPLGVDVSTLLAKKEQENA